MKDPYNLGRFVTAQVGTYEAATAELAAGRKTSHWMWFIFPQLRGLGQSPMAHHYGIGDLKEAKAYLEHPTLGPRLWVCSKLMLDAVAPSLPAILGADEA